MKTTWTKQLGKRLNIVLIIALIPYGFVPQNAYAEVPLAEVHEDGDGLLEPVQAIPASSMNVPELAPDLPLGEFDAFLGTSPLEPAGDSLDETGGAVTAYTLTEDYTTFYNWGRTSLTFGIDASVTSGMLITSAITLEDEIIGIRSDIETAFSSWAQYAPLTFTEKDLSSSSADIIIRALDTETFLTQTGGSTSTVAYAYYPSNGDIYLNAGKTFALTGFVGAGLSFLNTIMHELGHSLGLTHSTNSANIMYGYIDGQTTLSENDAANIQKMYGVGEGTVYMLGDAVPPPPPPAPTNPPVLSIAQTSYTVKSGETLVFSISASDPDGGNVTLSASGLPQGATFVDHGDGTGTFTWTPTDKQSSTGRTPSKDYKISLTATDSSGLATTVTVDITAQKSTDGGTPTKPGKGNGKGGALEDGSQVCDEKDLKNGKPNPLCIKSAAKTFQSGSGK